MRISVSITPRVSAAAGRVTAAPISAASNILSIRFSLLERIIMPDRDSQRPRPPIDLGRYWAIADICDTKPAEAKLRANRRQNQNIGQSGGQPTLAAGVDRPLIERSLYGCRIRRERDDPGVQSLPRLTVGAEYGRFQFAQILGRCLGIFKIIANDTEPQREVQAKYALGRIAHRQHPEPLVP